jgi:hypothetical protein
MNCEQVAGFLIPRPCPLPGVTICSICGKNVCTQHTSATAEGAMACTSCAATQGRGTDADEEETRDYYGYNQTAFHIHGITTPVYNQSDYQAFDGGGAGGTWDANADLVEDIEGS